ncbi:MAG TPA: PAS domain S-box protein, partial [Candidatus Bathyarchaeia archaeon]
LTGLKKEAVIGKRVTQAIPGIREANPELFDIYGRVALTGKEERFELYFKPLKIWLAVSAYSPSRGYFAAIFENITERKRTEAELRSINKELEERVTERTAEVSSERQRLYNVLETLPAYVVLLDKDYRVPFANKLFRERFGVSHGRPCYSFLFERDSPCENCETYKVMKNNRPHRWEWAGPDGRDYDIYDFPFVEADGSNLILEMGIDITERKRAEKQLNAASLYARSLIEASLDPLVTISAEGKITDVNEATELVTGFSRNQLIGSDFSSYFTQPAEAKKGYLKAFTEGYVRDYPLAIRHRDGKITHVLYNATVFKNEHGEVKGVFAAARDITERIQAEELAEENARKLKDAERLAVIGATAGMVGHDIRNPLQSIIAELYLARSELDSLPKGEAEENLKASMDTIEEQISYINKIVSDLQDFAKPLAPCIEDVDAGQLIQGVISTMNIPESIELAFSKKGDFPKLKTDSAFMKRIMTNLIANALQAMPNGGKLTITAQIGEEKAVISVQDTGEGIQETVKDKLFTPLFTTKAKGQGFGLSVVKRLVTALNGSVSFESQVGKGTRFIVEIPA